MTILWCAEFMGDLNYPYPSSSGTIAYNVISRLLDLKIDVAVADPFIQRHRGFITQSGKSLGRIFPTYNHRDIIDIAARLKPEKIVTDEHQIATALLSTPNCPEIVLIARNPELLRLESLGFTVVAVSQSLRDALKNKRIDSTYIPLGVDPNTFKKIEKPKKGVVFGCSCRNKTEKNFYRLMDAYRLFNDAYKDAAALAVHTDNGAWDVRRMAKQLGIQSHVFFAPWPADPAAMNRIYNSFDVHINVGGSEWSALSVLESMAIGIPQIASDYGVLREYAEGCGILVPAKTEIVPPSGHVHVPDATDIFNAMEKLWMNELERSEAGEAAMKKAMKYSWENSAQMWEELLLD